MCVAPRPFAVMLAISVLAGCQTSQGAADERADSTPPRDPSGAAGRIATEAVKLTLDRSSYRAGAQVRLTLANATNRSFGYNACTRAIEQQRDGVWVPFPEPDRVCTMELRLLEANAKVAEQTELPASIPRGTYRLALSVSDESASPGGPQRVISPTFTVE